MERHKTPKTESSSDGGVLLSDTASVRPGFMDFHDEEKLPHEVHNINAKGGTKRTIWQSLSSENLDMLEWGTTRRRTGKSKTALKITIPNRHIAGQLLTGPIFVDKSILYTYSSSLSGGSKTTNSFGAIGDHLPAKGSAPSTARSYTTLQQVPTPQRSPKHSEDPIQPSLKDLVDDSTPDVDMYELLVVEETGPLRQPITPRVIQPSNLRMVHRRRSLTDLVEEKPAILSPGGHAKTNTVGGVKTRGEEFPGLEENPNSANASDEIEEEPVTWVRQGPSFNTKSRMRGCAARRASTLDPETFTLPKGSIVYVMKASHITHLRTSIDRNLWSTREGASNVLQEAWERTPASGKIIFLFTVVHGGRFLGMAQMTGPYEPYVRPIFSAEKWRDTVGVIPMQWLVAKDVPFSFFDHLRHGQVPVREVRHANPIPGEIGRDAVRTYFEAAHADCVSLLPQGGILENQPRLHHSGYMPYGHNGYPYRYSPTQVHQSGDARLYNHPAPIYHPQGRPTVNSYMPQAVNPGFKPFPGTYQPGPSPNVNLPAPAYQDKAHGMNGRSPYVDAFTPVYPNGAPCVPGGFSSVGPSIPAYQDRGLCAPGPFPSVSSSRAAFQHETPHGYGLGSMYQSKAFPNVSPPTSAYHSDHSQSPYQTKNDQPVPGFFQQGANQAGFQQPRARQSNPCVAGNGRVTQINYRPLLF